MPLPDVALERGFGVELELVHVDFFAEELAQRFDEPRMAGKEPERLVEGVGGKGGARGAGLLPPHLLAVELEDRLGIVAQERDLLLGEAIGKEEVALLLEVAQLARRQLHGVFL